MQFENSQFNFSAATGARAARGVGRLTACATRSVLLGALLCGAPALFAQSAQTAYSRLGVPEVHSALGSPLWVKIPVEATDETAQITASSFSLGTRPLGAGIPFLETAEISFERQGGKYFLVIRSRQPVNDLAVGVVVREQLPHGVRSREFAVLLDPPMLFDARVAELTDHFAGVDAIDTTAPPSQPAPALTIATPPETSTLAPSTASAPVAQRTARTRAAINAPARPSATSAKTRSKRATAVRTESGAAVRKNPPEDRQMRLSLSTGNLSVMPNASEATRAELRLRQLILDTDDLTSALLERNHRIGLLETELSSLAARVSATERTLRAGASAPTSATSTPPTALTESAPVPAVPDAPPAPVTPQAKTVAGQVAPIAVAAKITAAPRPLYSWTNLLMSMAVALLAGAAFWLFRRRLRARDEAFRIVPQRADAYVAEVLAQSPVSIVRKPIASQINETAASPDAPTASTAAAAANVATPPIFPEIHFELPPFENAMSPAPDATPANPGAIADAATLAVIADIKSADEDARGRRFRYLSSRYQDIAIMMPPLDAPLRLLSQAGRINDEGAADFAKRFLKYAAYSRPYTEEYWLALLELLYREKFVNDYLVNAKWFREYHPDSTHWDEVQRIGYLLDPAAPVFASAAAWSHEEPVIGVWLPSNQSQAKSVTGRHELKLELAD